MVDHDDTLPRKEPSQERSRALVDALIEATARIIEAEGPQKLTTNRVADVAGASIGSLYQYFPNKESLLAAVIERELERDMALVRGILEANAELPLRDLIELLTGQLVEQTRNRGGLHHEILPLIDDVHRRALVLQERQALSALFQSLVADHLDELPRRHTDGPDASQHLECAAFLTMRAMELGLNAIKVEAPHFLDHPELAGLLTRIFDALMIQE